MTSWYRIEREGTTAQLHLTDEIGFGQCDVAELIAELRGVARVEMTINSAGGCGRTASALYDALRGRCPEAIILGECASAAALIAMVADRISIHPEGHMMVHSPRACSFATAVEMREQADWLDRMTETWIERLRERTGAPAETVRGWFDGADHWFSAPEALAVGLTDAILEIAPPRRAAPESVEIPASIEAGPHGEEELLVDLLRALGPIRTADKAKLFRNLSAWFGTSIQEIKR